jgi:hypothetical protein
MIELPIQKKGKPRQLKIKNSRGCKRLPCWMKKTGNGKLILYYNEGVWLFPKHKKKSVFYGNFDESYRISKVSTVSELDMIIYPIQLCNSQKK